MTKLHKLGRTQLVGFFSFYILVVVANQILVYLPTHGSVYQV